MDIAVRVGWLSVASPARTVTDTLTPTDAVATTLTVGSTSWPDANNTGHTTPIGSLTASGSITATNGQTIQGLRITGSINVVGKTGVTIRDCLIESGGFFPIDAESATNMLVEDTTIIGGTGTNANILDTAGGPNVYRRLDLSGAQDGIKLGADSLLVDSYIHDLSPYDPVGDTHNDGIQFGDAQGITVRHNYIVMGAGATSAILMGGGEARLRAKDCLIEDNYLSGGGYTFYGPTAPSGGTNVSGGPSENVQVLNNSFADDSGFGAVSQWETGIGNVWSGNTFVSGPRIGQAVPTS